MSPGLPEFDMLDNGPPAGMGYPGPTPYGGTDSLLQIAWRGKWLIALVTLLGLGGAYAYLQKLPLEYSSTSRILVSVPDTRLKSDIPIPVVSKPNLATQASMITSPAIVSAALSDPNVLVMAANHGGNLQDLTRKLSARAGKDDIISVGASAPSPEGAAAIVNAVVQAYARWHAANRQLSTAEFLQGLNAQLDRLSQELVQKRRDMMLFEQRNPGVVESARGGLVSRTVDLLKQELVMARLQAIQLNSVHARLKGLAEDPNKFRQYLYSQQNAVSLAVDEGEWVRVTEELQKIRLQLEQLAAGGPVQKAQIALLQNRESRLAQRSAELEQGFVRKYLELAGALVEDAVARERQLTDMYGQETVKIQGMGKDNAEYALLVAECDILGRQYSSLSEQINKVPADSGQAGVNVYVLAKATPAAKPDSSASRVLGLGLIVGLMAGGGLALLRDWRDQRLRSAQEIAALLETPILGAIPSASRRTLRRSRKLRFAANSQESEACRAIRTALLCGTRRDQMRTILVTSPGSGEGKTLLVSNLGAAMAQVGQKTLIVDADLRKPLAERIFTANGHSVGLVDVLGGTIELREAIRATDIEGLYLLEGGQSTRNPAELLTSPRFAALLAQLGGEYDRILIDSPPVGLVTDAQVLATLSGATLLVLRAEKSSRLLTQRARDALLAVGVRVAGAVVNDVPKGDSRYGHFSGYGYYYAAGGSNGHNETRKESSVTAEERPGPEKVQATYASPLPVSAPDGAAMPNGTPVQAGPALKIKTAPAKKNGRRGTRNESRTTEGLPLKDKAPSTAEQAGTGLGEGGARVVEAPSAGASTPETADRPAPTSAEPAVAAEPKPPSGGPAPAKKRNGRNGIKSDPAANDATQPPASGETVRKEPPKDINSPPDPRDPAEDWREWLKGNQ